MEEPKPLTYKQAGVDIEAGERLVDRIKPHAASTSRPEVLAGIGGFGALFSLADKRYRHPVLVSATDGVGTKLKIAQRMGKHDTVGIDLVAMSANDILTLGAEPLFFLDYLATSRLDLQVAEEVIKGIAEGCRQAGCALIGGETAEMPDFYAPGEYDLAGFIVGIVEREKVIDGSRIAPGDPIIGLASSGLHSNGFSLARKILFGLKKYEPQDQLPELGISLGKELLRPTRIYVQSVLALKERFTLKGLAHITGGGLPGNLPRILPEGCQAAIRLGSWRVPAIFSFLQKAGGVPEEEMFRVFNMGIGMALIVPAREAEGILSAARSLGEEPWIIGEIVAGEKRVRFVSA
ncbi:MAG: phosphoribosylformylglycinamidine cyclo-ligase [candidate division NC10 bacterium]|nr:phosphoribosylformylglycinamidine cyclo-ligase [candidate division NC10 bacterium]